MQKEQRTMAEQRKKYSDVLIDELQELVDHSRQSGGFVELLKQVRLRVAHRRSLRSASSFGIVANHQPYRLTGLAEQR
jgi:hypothetical protein